MEGLRRLARGVGAIHDADAMVGIALIRREGLRLASGRRRPTVAGGRRSYSEAYGGWMRIIPAAPDGAWRESLHCLPGLTARANSYRSCGAVSGPLSLK